MLRTVITRIGAAIPTLLGVTIVLFVALRLLPGDPMAAILGGAETTPEAEAALRAQYGFDKPIAVQYWDFLVNALTLDLGDSYSTRQPVTEMIGQQVGHTLQLALAAVFVSVAAGVALGCWSALRRDKIADAIIRVTSLVITAMPSFWVGLLAIMLFSFALGWFPPTGSGGLSTLVLPALTLGLSAAGTITRLVRHTILETLGEPFVIALHAKGLPPSVVVGKHVLRNAVIPTITVAGLQVGAIFAGAVIVETVFARRGIGQMLTQALGSGDYPVVQGVVLCIAAMYIVVNLLVDISYSLIDPRIRAGSK